MKPGPKSSSHRSPAAGGDDQLADRRAGPRRHGVDRRRVGHRLHPGRVRPLREAVRRSDLAGWAEYGYCASHSRHFWGLRLHLLCTLHGLPIGFALTGAKADERRALLDILTDPTLADRPRQLLIGDKNYFGRDFETTLAATGVQLLRPARTGEPDRPGARFFKPLRQVIESINDTFKGQLDLEHHGG